VKLAFELNSNLEAGCTPPISPAITDYSITLCLVDNLRTLGIIFACSLARLPISVISVGEKGQSM